MVLFRLLSCRFLRLLWIMLRLLLLTFLTMVVWLMHISVIIRLFLCTISCFLLLQTLHMSMESQFILSVVAMKSGRKPFVVDVEAMFHPFAPAFDPDRDLQQVEPCAAIDIKEVYNTGIVPVAAPSFVDHYNDCDDPNAIVGRPRNDFDADRMVSGVNEGIREAAAAKKAES